MIRDLWSYVNEWLTVLLMLLTVVNDSSSNL